MNEHPTPKRNIRTSIGTIMAAALQSIGCPLDRMMMITIRYTMTVEMIWLTAS